MQSKMKMSYDFDRKKPFVELEIGFSDDVRDMLFTEFSSQLNGLTLATAVFQPFREDKKVLRIYPGVITDDAENKSL